MPWGHIFVCFGKGIEIYIRLLGNASKMYGEVKFAINSDSQYFYFFAVFNGNVVRYEICLQIIFYAKKLKGAFIRTEEHKVFIIPVWSNSKVLIQWGRNILYIFFRWACSTVISVISKLALLKKIENYHQWKCWKVMVPEQILEEHLLNLSSSTLFFQI